MNLIFDISNIYYRSYFKVLKYQNKTEEENKHHLVRKFFIDFSFICNMFVEVNKVICCFDSKTYRKKIDVNYKSNRAKKPNFFYDCLDEVKYYLTINGFIVLKQDGLEADDLIYVASEVYENNCIISNDEDIRQYLNLHTCNLVLKKQNDLYFNYKTLLKTDILKKEYLHIVKKVNPVEITIKKILLGDKSDCIPKLAKRGVGEKSIQIILDNKNFFLEKSFINKEKFVLLYNRACKDNITINQVSKNMDLISFNGNFDDKIFINNSYTYSKEIKMQEILNESKYLK